jgi:hypothetical protein
MVLHSFVVLFSAWFPWGRPQEPRVDAADGLVWERHPVEQKHLRDEARRQIDQWYWNRRA